MFNDLQEIRSLFSLKCSNQIYHSEGEKRILQKYSLALSTGALSLESDLIREGDFIVEQIIYN